MGLDQRAAGMRLRAGFDIINGTLNHNLAAICSRLGSKIDDPVGRTNNIQVVFNNQ